MSGLSKNNNYPLLPGMRLPEQETNVILAHNTDFCRDLIEGPQVQLVLEEYNRKALTAAGMRQNQELTPEQRIEVISTMEYVVSQHKWLRVGELRIILSKGILGELGEAHSYNAKALTAWIATYNEQVKQPALVEYNKQEQIVKEEQEAEEKKQRILAQLDTMKMDNRRAFFERVETERLRLAFRFRQGGIEWNELPDDIDPWNRIFKDLRKNYHYMLGFSLQESERIFKEETERARRKYARKQNDIAKDAQQYGVERVVMYGEEEIRKEAEFTSMSRLLRMYVANLLNEGKDVEDHFKSLGLWQ